MKPITANKPVTIFVSLLLLTSTVSSSLAFAQPPDSLVETVTSAGWDSPGMAQIAIHTGREITRHLEAAHAALAQGESGKALGNVQAANRLNDSVLQMMPYMKVKEDLFNAKGKLDSEQVDVFYDQLLPIYAELDAMEIDAPQMAQQARTKLKAAEAASRKGDTKAANSTVQEVIDMVAATEIDLPVVYLHEQLATAQQALGGSSRDTAAAKAALDNALKSITAVTSGVAVVGETK